MEERNKKTELLVGLFLFVGMILLGALILQFSSVRELFKGTYSLTVALPDGTGIRDGTPVMLGGSKIGKASAKPKLNDKFTGVLIPLEIYQSVKIPADAKFSIGTAGLLGDAFIEIKPTGKETTKFVEPNTLIQGAPAGGMADLKDTASKIGEKVDIAVEDVRGAVKDLREALKKMNEGVLSDAAMKDLKESFKHLNNLATRLDEKTFSDKTSTDIKDAMASLKNTAKTFEDSVKKLDPTFAKVDGVVEKADKIMVDADAAIKSIDKGGTALGDAAKDLRSGEGLLPAMIKDPQLKNEFKTLITNLRQHGILFYHDDSGKPEGASGGGTSRPPRVFPGSKR